MQMRFVEEYIQDPSSASRAAKRAGYSLSTAPEVASRLLADPRVQRMIEEATQQAIKALGITKERVLQELAVIAFSNPNSVITMDEKGEPVIDLLSLKSDKSGATEVSISVVNGRSGKQKIVNIKTVKPADKVAALEKLGKAMNMFKEQVEVTQKVSLVDLIEQSYGPQEIEQPDYLAIESSPVEESTQPELPLESNSSQ